MFLQKLRILNWFELHEVMQKVNEWQCETAKCAFLNTRVFQLQLFTIILCFPGPQVLRVSLSSSHWLETQSNISVSLFINYLQRSYFIYYLLEDLHAAKSCKARISYLMHCTLASPSKPEKSLDHLLHRGTKYFGEGQYFYWKSRLAEWLLHFKALLLP